MDISRPGRFYGVAVVVITMILFSHVGVSSAMSDEKRLIKHLLENYARVGQVGRPIYNASHAMQVNTGLSLLKLQVFDQDNSLMKVLAILRMSWRDILLTWDEDDFGGVSQVVVPDGSVWTPDVVFLNAVSPPRLVHGSRILVTSEGDVTWSRQVSVQVYCDPEASSPDKVEPNCQIKFASWTLDQNQLTLTPIIDRVDSSGFSYHHTWELYKSRADQGLVSSPCCQGQHDLITYTITLARQEKEAPEEPENSTEFTRWQAWVTMTTLALLLLHRISF